MNRIEFMSQLEHLLQGIPESDRQDAIAYYNDYFDEAGKEKEAQVIQELGSPDRVVANIKADLKNGYTENGYRDEMQETNLPAKKEKRNIPWPLLVILAIFAAPLLVGVGGGLFGGLLGILAGILGIAFAIIVCAFAFVLTGPACIVMGIIEAVTSPVEGFLVIAIGCVVLAAGLLLTVLCIWCVFKWLPALFRVVMNWCQKIFGKHERRSDV